MQREYYLLIIVRVQACLNHEGLAKIIKETGVTSAHLWRRARNINPKLKIQKVLFKPPLPPKVQDARVKIAKKLYQRPQRDFEGATFMDETTLPVLKLTSGSAIGEKGEYIVQPTYLVVGVGTPDLPKEARGKIHIFLAVHPKEGLVFWDYLSPTTGYRRPRGKRPFEARTLNFCIYFF